MVSKRSGIAGTLASALLSNRKALAGAAVLAAFTLIAIFAPVISPYDPHALQFEPILGPSRAHLLGTTGNGQDIFSQLMWSTRESLLLAVVAGIMATVIAVVVGVSAAYLGGLWDHVLNLVTDVFLVIPTLPLMIVVAAYAASGGVAVLIAVIVITGWSYGARQLRSPGIAGLARGADRVLGAHRRADGTHRPGAPGAGRGSGHGRGTRGTDLDRVADGRAGAVGRRSGRG